MTIHEIKQHLTIQEVEKKLKSLHNNIKSVIESGDSYTIIFKNNRHRNINEFEGHIEHQLISHIESGQYSDITHPNLYLQYSVENKNVVEHYILEKAIQARYPNITLSDEYRIWSISMNQFIMPSKDWYWLDDIICHEIHKEYLRRSREKNLDFIINKIIPS